MRTFDFVLPALLVISGCGSDQPRITMARPAPLQARFDEDQARVVAARYLLIPVEILPPRENFGDWGLSSASGSIGSSSWSGLGFGSVAVNATLNIKVLDLQSGKKSDIFDRQVAVGGWNNLSFDPRSDSLRFDDLLLIPARAADTNSDGQISIDDSAALYVYCLTDGKLIQASPAGSHLNQVRLVGHEILMLLNKTPADPQLRVYSYNPRTNEGRFVGEAMTP